MSYCIVLTQALPILILLADQCSGLTEVELGAVSSDSYSAPRFVGEILKKQGWKTMPDFWPEMPSPAPGPSLDDIIFQSSDGNYRGISLRRNGVGSSLVPVTTPITYPSTSVDPAELVENLRFRVEDDDAVENLRMIQSRINRLKMNTTPPPARKITRPLIASYGDPNFRAIYNMKQIEGDTRRMWPHGGMPPNTALNQKILQLSPNRKLPPTGDRYNSFNRIPDYKGGTTPSPEDSILTELLSPLQLFKLKYGPTTPHRIRTRRPKSKTAPTVSSINKEEEDYHIPEESELDDASTTDIPNAPDESDVHVSTERPNILRSETEAINKEVEEEKEKANKIKTNRLEEPKVIDAKTFKQDKVSFAATTNYTPTFKQNKPYFGIPKYKKLNVEVTTSGKSEHEVLLSEELAKEVKIMEPKNNETINDKEVDNPPPADTDTPELTKDSELSEFKPSGDTMRRYFEGPGLSKRKKEPREMDKELKTILMSDEEETPKQNEDIKVEYDDIDGIPIRKRKRSRNHWN